MTYIIFEIWTTFCLFVGCGDWCLKISELEMFELKNE